MKQTFEAFDRLCASVLNMFMTPEYDDSFEQKLADLVEKKFESGNEIPVERITLTRAEIEAL